MRKINDVFFETLHRNIKRLLVEDFQQSSEQADKSTERAIELLVENFGGIVYYASPKNKAVQSAGRYFLKSASDEFKPEIAEEILKINILAMQTLSRKKVFYFPSRHVDKTNKKKKAVEFYYFEQGKSVKEISQILKCSYAHVYNLINLAKIKRKHQGVEQ